MSAVACASATSRPKSGSADANCEFAGHLGPAGCRMVADLAAGGKVSDLLNAADKAERIRMGNIGVSIALEHVCNGCNGYILTDTGTEVHTTLQDLVVFVRLHYASKDLYNY